jgi:hypothetical protein
MNERNQLGKKPSAAQRAVLALASGKQFVSFHEAVGIGAPGPTLAAAVRAGWLTKNQYPDGSNDWSITDAGRAALKG